MMKKFYKKFTSQPTEKRSSTVLYALVGLIVVVFALFWLVGFSRPYIDDPNFNAPLFTDLLLVTGYLLLALAIGIAVWAVMKSARTLGKGDRFVNNIPVRRISLSVWIGTFVLMLLVFALGSSSPLKINGATYSDGFWLRMSDMFIITSLLLIVAAIASVIYGATKYNRKS